MDQAVVPVARVRLWRCQRRILAHDGLRAAAHQRHVSGAVGEAYLATSGIRPIKKHAT